MKTCQRPVHLVVVHTALFGLLAVVPQSSNVNGSTLANMKHGGDQMVALYRNDGKGRFADVTPATGLKVRIWGMGTCIADYDNDGFQDVYVTAFGPNVLGRNNGDGTFTDVTARAGVGDPRLSASAAWGDFNGDGFLDLFVAN